MLKCSSGSTKLLVLKVNSEVNENSKLVKKSMSVVYFGIIQQECLITHKINKF